MHKIIELFLIAVFKLAFWVRYRVKVKGVENLTPKNLSKPGGVLFLPNHPAALVDPALISLAIWTKFPIRPLIVEYMYFLPVVHQVMEFTNALPVPDFETSTNTLKRKRNEMVQEEVIKGLKKGENFLVYPAGRLKHTCIENIGGASATHQIIESAPEANVVLVKIKGLWGSSFSRALTGRVPPLFPTLWVGVKTALKNLLFFSPRRKVEIEFYPAPADFPYKGTRLEINQWLEKWYNRPDGLTEQEGEYPGESLILVPPLFWSKKVPTIQESTVVEDQDISVEGIDEVVKEKVYAKLTELTEIESGKIRLDMSLASDLGMDSLDISELAVFMQDYFDTGPVPVTELTTVRRVLAIASKEVKIAEIAEETQQDLSKWQYNGSRFKCQIAHGDTIPEVFLHNCERMGNAPAIADMRSGILTYHRMKMATILFAEVIRKYPGKYIGIMLPASVGAYLTVVATIMAGKIPLMINWTIGPRHLKAVRELSKVEVVLTSWAFLERLDAVDLTGVDDIMVMLESLRRKFTLVDKIRAFIRSKYSVKGIMKALGCDHLTKDDPAVLLFTSGTESMPKGVPLTHENLLSSQRATFEAIDLFSDDVLLGMLPPFHIYGFNTSGLMGLFSGIRTAYFPKPTDGKGVAKACEIWGVTVMSGAPTFIKGMLKAAKPEQLKTLRLCVTGAEKAPPELFQLMADLGKEQCMLEGYGVTECSPILTANRPGKPRKGVGSPFPGVELCIVHSETHEPLPMGSEGLILARGPNVFHGYINPGLASPFLTVEGKEWYNTGDIGYQDEESRLTISGRKKRFIKIGGEMISLQSLESALLEAAPAKGWRIQEEGPSLAVIALERPGGKPIIRLISTFEAQVDEVNQTLRDGGISNLVKMDKVIVLEEIPIMGTGKINYRQLEEQYLANVD